MSARQGAARRDRDRNQPAVIPASASAVTIDDGSGTGMTSAARTCRPAEAAFVGGINT